MGLSTDLISQFVKATSKKTNEKKETIVYGTVVIQGNEKYVRLDGSEYLTPISNTSNVGNNDRVTVMIKNHTATVTGNLTSPSARYITDENGNKTVEGADISKISEFEIVLAYRVTTNDLNAINANINNLRATIADIESVEAIYADIDNLQAKFAELTYVDADEVTALYAEIESIRSKFGTFADISTEKMEAIDADIKNLKANVGDFTYVSADILSAINADVKNLDTEKLSAEEAKITYANIDFSNIGKAAMEYFYANSGLIDNVTISDGTITGNLVGVTIRGDLIEGNTVFADKLVIKGEDGLYYKLNTDGITTESEQTEYNSLNGQVILAKSITATQINVDDLVAFDATIGGFNITDTSIYSEVKDSEGNTTRGVYMDTDGQVNFGDETNYVKYYKDEDGTYKLVISADTILYSINGDQHSLSDLGVIGEYVKIGTYEDEPCIELGEKDSDFKLLITNTRMLFMEGSNVVAYVTNQSLYIQKAVIKEELQQGGFVWKARSNGNLGLIWKGDS